MLDVKYEGLGGTGLVTTPLNMAPNLSECNVSHSGIAQNCIALWGGGVWQESPLGFLSDCPTRHHIVQPHLSRPSWGQDYKEKEKLDSEQI